MDGYSKEDIVEIINNKRKKIMVEKREFPNTIEISTSLLMFLKLNYLSIMNEPLQNIKEMFGMKIIINDRIDSPEEIEVYYKKEI